MRSNKSMSEKTTKLPAPPKFDPSSISLPTASASKSKNRTKVNSSGNNIASHLNLPKAPPALPIKKSIGLTNATITTTSANISSDKSKNDPLQAPSEPPVLASVPVSGSVPESESETELVISSDSTMQTIAVQPPAPHATTENIPKLESSPPSAVSLPSPAQTNTSTAIGTGTGAPQSGAKKTPETSTPMTNTENVRMDTAVVTTESAEPTIPKLPKRKYTCVQNPQNTLLAHAQKSIPILIQASDNAQIIAQKNNTTLSEMFTALGNSMTRESPAILGKLAPIRSVSRMVGLKWDMINLGFFESSFSKEHEMSAEIIRGDETGDASDHDDFLNGRHWEERLQYVSENWKDEADLSTLEQQVEDLFASRYDVREDFNDSIDTVRSVGSNDGGSAPRERAYEDNQREVKALSLLSNHKTPWLARFRNGINRQTSYLPHTMLHCPPVILYIASTKDTSLGVDELSRLKHQYRDSLPAEFQSEIGLFDPDSMKAQFLLLHDEKDGPKDFSESKVLQEMRNRFGTGCAAVVRVDTDAVVENTHGIPATFTDVVNQPNAEEDSMWDKAIQPHAPLSHMELGKDIHKMRGKCLSSRDKLALRRFIAQMVTSVVIPAIERRIYDLNIEVTNHKKGVKNVFKSFWRKPKESGGLSNSMHGLNQSMHSSVGGTASVGGTSAGGVINGVPYRYDTIESQTRLLADTLFLIRDYEAALGMYRLVRDDYKHDQNLMHNASAHEMMALSLYLTDLTTGYRSTKEIIQYMESALYLYTSAAEEDRLNNGGSRPVVASVATRCVTRLCLLLSSIRTLCKGRDMETADSLAAASSKETPLGAAVLLEQSSGHYYRAGMHRKFAFHMLMAGHMFRSAGQEHQAVRCFASAMYVYHGGERSWSELFNHLTSALAGQLYGMKRMQLSLQLYAKLVGSTGGGRVSVRSQQKFLDHLVAISRGYEEESLESVQRMKIAYYGRESGDLEEANNLLESHPQAKRNLEIPNMNLPKILDSTLKVESPPLTSSSDKSSSDSITFGSPAEGDESVWQDLFSFAQAELRATSSTQSSDIPVNELTNAVIEEIDEEQQARTKARKKTPSTPNVLPVRAKLEPLSVSFEVSNPLSVIVPVSSMQIVAKLTCAKTKRLYTNIEAIESCPDTDEPKKGKKWRFSGSDKVFETAHFARISLRGGPDDGQWQPDSTDDENPFFLVTKGKMAMEPGFKKRISLGICPLVMGDLEIIGVRCKIFNEIWVYHKFNVLGPLLHNTSYNRENRVRDVPYLLRSKIECNMPNLSVDIIQTEEHGSNGLVLQGQVSKWTIRVFNQGAAPATNLYLKTNVPRFNVCDGENVQPDEISKTSHCIGPSGTMMRLPLHRKSGTSGIVDILSSGQTIDIPIEIRTSGGGRQEFYMLFCYELFQKNVSSKAISTQPKIRWLRKMLSVAVYPSLTMTASLKPFFSNKNHHILSLEMANYRSDQQSNLEILVEKISVASKNYGIKALFDDGKPRNQMNADAISWQEQATMHFLIFPLGSNSSQCTLSECTIRDGSENANYPRSATDFICLEHAHDQFIATLTEHQKELARMEAEQDIEGQHPRSIHQIRRANKSKPNTSENGDNTEPYKAQPFHPTSLARLCSPNHSTSEINVICSWRTKGNAPGDLIVGQHHLRSLAVRPQNRSKTCPLLVTATFNGSITHDFTICPLKIPMEISIRNRLVSSKVDFEFLMEGTSEFEFIGPECFRKTLDGGKELVFPMQAVVFQSGMHDLQCVRVTIYQDDGTETFYVFPLQWIVQATEY